MATLAAATVVVFKPHDIVLTQINPGLYLDDFERDVSGVGQTMGFAQRNIGRLIFGQQDGLVAIGDFGSALDHNPMLGPVVVHLQAEAGLWIDLDALDLEPVAVVDAVVPTPRPMHLAVQGVFFTASGLELGDDRLDVLAARSVGNQHSVGCFNNDEVIDAHKTDEAAGGVHQVVPAIGGEGIAKVGIAGSVLGQALPDGIPGTEVGPSGGKRDHLHGKFAAGAVFHHGVVDRLGRDGGKFGLAWADKLFVGGAISPCGSGGMDDVGAEAFKGRHPDRGLKHEHASIPIVATFIKVTLGGDGIGLFDEALNAEVRCRRNDATCERYGLDVTVAGFRTIGGDPEDNDAVGRRFAHGLLHCLGEGRLIGDGLVGRDDDEDWITPRFERSKSSQRECRRSIAADGLKQDCANVNAGLAQLFERKESVVFISNNEWGRHRNIVGSKSNQPRGGLLKQTFVGSETEKLLRETGARQRPQTRARAAAEDNRLNNYRVGQSELESGSIANGEMWKVATSKYGGEEKERAQNIGR